jgi:hypothetical protein
MTAGSASTDLLYGVKEIARHVGKSPKTIEHWISRGLIPTFRIGTVVCSTRSGLAAFFEAKMRPQGPFAA